MNRCPLLCLCCPLLSSFWRSTAFSSPRRKERFLRVLSGSYHDSLSHRHHYLEKLKETTFRSRIHRKIIKGVHSEHRETEYIKLDTLKQHTAPLVRLERRMARSYSTSLCTQACHVVRITASGPLPGGCELCQANAHGPISEQYGPIVWTESIKQHFADFLQYTRKTFFQVTNLRKYKGWLPKKT